jgi:hypothetical protein
VPDDDDDDDDDDIVNCQTPYTDSLGATCPENEKQNQATL